MAAPTVNASAISNPGGTGSTLTVSLATHAADDIIINYLAKTGNAAWTVPSGWNLLDQRIIGTSSNGVVGTWFWRRVLAGDTLPLTNPVCTLGATVTRMAVSRAIRGPDLTGIFTSSIWGARGFATGTANPIRPPSVTTLTAEMLILHCYGQRSSTNAPDPSGYTQDQEIIISGNLVLNASRKVENVAGTLLSNQDASPTSGVRWAAGILCIPPPLIQAPRTMYMMRRHR